MENNLNISEITAYCNRFCEKLTDRHFETKNVITGQEILDLQEIRQINLFVMRYLFSEWTKEAARIKSPYFDYGDAEVKNAMKDFMNVLSRHIAIEKDDFLPLLKRATYDTLLLIFSPYDYYTQLSNDGFSLKELRRTAKYVKINNNILQEIIKRLEHMEVQQLSEGEARNLLNEVFQNIQETPADIDEFITRFSATEPLSLTIVYGSAASRQDPEKHEAEQHFVDGSGEENQNNSYQTEAAPDGPFITHDEEFSNDDDEDEEKEWHEPATKASDEELKTLNERHSEAQKSTLADIHRKQKIDSLRKHISINQRFMFINSLFEGEEDIYNNVLDYLESCGDRDMAMSFLSSEYSNWDFESEEVVEFLELIEKRF